MLPVERNDRFSHLGLSIDANQRFLGRIYTSIIYVGTGIDVECVDARKMPGLDLLRDLHFSLYSLHQVPLCGSRPTRVPTYKLLARIVLVD
jgi:hypothetical protein